MRDYTFEECLESEVDVTLEYLEYSGWEPEALALARDELERENDWLMLREEVRHAQAYH